QCHLPSAYRRLLAIEMHTLSLHDALPICFYLRIRRAQHKAVELTEKHAPLVFDIGLNSYGVWVQVSCPLDGGSEFYSVRRTVYYTQIEKNPETCPIIEMLGAVADDLSRLLGNRLLPKK